MGIASIARATVPLALFGHERYATLMGRIAMPTLIAQAAAPSIGALLMERFGPEVTLGALFATALVNIVLVIAVFGLQRSPGSHQTGSTGSSEFRSAPPP